MMTGNETPPSRIVRTQGRSLRKLAIAFLGAAMLSAGAATAIAQQGEITLDDVLQDPNNVELNLRYARQQVEAGNLLSASATLERILILDPNLHQARLFYAVVLFRLDNMEEAEEQLERLSQVDLPDEQAEEVEAYLARVQRRQQPFRMSADIAFGARYDTNRNAIPASDTVLFVDIPVELLEDEEDDVGLIAAGRLFVEYEPPIPEGHTAFGALRYYQNHQFEVDEQSLQDIAAEIGATFRAPGYALTPSVYADYVRLSYEDYVFIAGGALRGEWEATKWVRPFARVYGQHEEYQEIDEDELAEGRDGPRFRGGVGVTIDITPQHRLVVEAAAATKRAEFDFLAFDRIEGVGSHLWLFGAGQFLRTSALLQRDIYDEADPFVSVDTRRDFLALARMTYGVPFGTISNLMSIDLPEAIAEIGLSLTGEYLYRDSNIDNFEFDNLSAELLVSKSFAF